MRLDHLLSMETGTDFHGSVGVDEIDEVRHIRCEYRPFVVQFSRISERELEDH